jgi:serine/threonine-protein kinase HipA
MATKMQEVNVCFSPSPQQLFPVGVLALHQHRLFFEYDNSWLQRSLHLSPFILPNKSGLIEHTQREFGPLFGLFDDSLPDGWGLLLMDRYFRQQGFDLAQLSSLDRLLYLGRNTMGALTYHPPASNSPSDMVSLNLYELARDAKKVYEGEESEVLPMLLRTGGSPGGARPKVLVGYDDEQGTVITGEGDLPRGYSHWLVKFSAREGGPDSSAMEFAYSRMAVAAGIAMPECRLFHAREGDCYFGVKRFDRLADNRRVHTHTFGNLIQANFRIPSCDYGDLFKVTSLLTRNQADMEQAFRLMVFNVLAHNRDDHVKNFSFMMDHQTGDWSLAPAYDLTFSPGPGGEHSTSVAGHGRAIAKRHCLTLAEQHDIQADVAEEIISQVQQAVVRWSDFAQGAGVSAMQIQKVATGLLEAGKGWL